MESEILWDLPSQELLSKLQEKIDRESTFIDRLHESVSDINLSNKHSKDFDTIFKVDISRYVCQYAADYRK